MLDLDFDDEDAALAATVQRFCAERAGGADTSTWPNALWRGLADLGVLALNTPEGGGTALSVVAAMEQLGQANVPGPLVATLFAVQVLDAEARKAVAAGEAIVAVGEAPLVPWLPVASVVIELVGGHAHLARVAGEVELVDTLGGEPWGRAALERLADLGPAGAAQAVADAATAAYLAGAGHHLLDLAAAYAKDRVQFKVPIGSFQAVSHPLADAALHLTAARTLARTAAHAVDRDDPHAPAKAAAARLSATKAALDVAYRAHQTFGAMGFTVEGPVAAVSARIRQVASLPPRPAVRRELALSTHGL